MPFAVIVIDRQAIVPKAVRLFTTVLQAKAFAESLANGDKDAIWEGTVYGYPVAGLEEIDEPIAAIFGVSE